MREGTEFRPVRYDHVPVDAFLRQLARAATETNLRRYERIAHQLVLDLATTALCVYDSRRLPIAFSPVAIERHPLISRNGAELRRNGEFRYEPA